MIQHTCQGDPRLLPATVLAYIGDSVFELYTRLYVVDHCESQVKGIHRKTISIVSAKAQAAGMRRILDTLTEEEVLIFKRGRNTHTRSMAKNADAADYQVATGFETLIGYLYLTGNEDRLYTILSNMIEENAK